MPTSKIHEALSIMKELRPIMDKPHLQTNGSHLLDVKASLYQRIMQFAPGESIDQAMKNIMQVVRPKLSTIRTDLAKPKGPVPADVQLVLDKIETELADWLRQAKLELQRNDCSRLHKLVEAMQHDRVFALGTVNHSEFVEATVDVLRLSRSWEITQTFVVTHNWAAAFKGARDFDDLADFKLPYDDCCFELRIAGKTVLYACRTDEDDEILVQPFVECGDTWIASKEMRAMAKISPSAGFLAFGVSQVRAICVALEAEVAKHDVVRAPAKLNKARLSARKPPLNDYHVVSLARRSTVANPREPSHTGVHKRLHFRRGHWRHYPEFKTWVRWCLAGDPDLGFIDKDYTL